MKCCFEKVAYVIVIKNGDGNEHYIINGNYEVLNCVAKPETLNTIAGKAIKIERGVACGHFKPRNKAASNTGASLSRVIPDPENWRTFWLWDKTHLPAPSMDGLLAYAPLEFEPELSGFLSWLLKRRDEDSHIGDLAQYIADDLTFPFTSMRVDDMAEYIAGWRASLDVLAALHEAWRLYLADSASC